MRKSTLLRTDGDKKENPNETEGERRERNTYIPDEKGHTYIADEKGTPIFHMRKDSHLYCR